MVDPIMNPWDLLPLVPVLEGAGARVSDWQGHPANHAGATSAVACAPELLDEVIRLLNP
jgi:myo-inositol-1(or 4)-monophosphatase